ncbi:MAG: hypothetical protein ACRC6C_02745 [Wolbachia pipientis]
MLLACYSHKHISYRIRTIIRKAILSQKYLSSTHFKSGFGSYFMIINIMIINY